MDDMKGCDKGPETCPTDIAERQSSRLIDDPFEFTHSIFLHERYMRRRRDTNRESTSAGVTATANAETGNVLLIP